MSSLSRFARRLALPSLLLTLTAAGCATDRSPVAPDRASTVGRAGLDDGLESALDVAPALVRTTPLAANVSASATIGVSGGEIRLDRVGLRLRVPSGALTHKTVIRVTAYAGSAVAYEFEPHGIRFLVPVRFEQELSETSWERLTSAQRLLVQVGYFASPADLDLASGTAAITEWIPSAVDLSGSKVRADLSHFSGYMVSSGRR